MAMTNWAVTLVGSASDLQAWEWWLPTGFDPWVERSKDNVVLHAAAFKGLGSSEEVEECAFPLVRLLNGAIAIAEGQRGCPALC